MLNLTQKLCSARQSLHHTLPPFGPMLYLFEAGNWIKVGYTGHTVWNRLVSLRATKHPSQLCATLRDLGSVELRAVWPATMEREKEIHAVLRGEFPQHVGEWYPATAAGRLRELMGEPAELPTRPPPRNLPWHLTKTARPCCIGVVRCRCAACGKTFCDVKGRDRHQNKGRCRARSRTPPP